MFAAKNELFTRPSGYQISRSVRLRSSASAYFNRTPVSNSTSTTIRTFSAWVKRGQLSSSLRYTLFYQGVSAGSGQIFFIEFQNDSIRILYDGGATYNLVTTAVFRDSSAWYHIVVTSDTTQATSSDRTKIYINNVLQTSTGTQPPQNYTAVNGTTSVHAIGSISAVNYFDGYLTEINFIDGQALTPSSFGQYNANGVWSPKKYAGTYGTNGFYLNFSDNSAATAAAIGKDYSGNANNWTPNNISVTAGATYDSMLDVPTLYADGGNGRGNYAVLNAVANPSTLLNANLTTNGGDKWSISTIGMSSGKWYCEVTVTTVGAESSMGLSTLPFSGTSPVVGNGTSTAWGYYSVNGNKFNNGTGTAYGASYTSGDIIGIAFDANAGTLTFYKNNVSQGTAFSGLTSGPYFFALEGRTTTSANNCSINFGQRPFTYTPPTGFVALNTQNLSTPTIANGAAYMAATLWTGTGAASISVSNTVNGTSFQPDFIWAKQRNIAQNNTLADSVRGTGSLLFTDTTSADYTATTYGQVTSFNSNGFTGSLGSNITNSFFNQTSGTYVGWQWKAGTTSASNTNGTITSTVSVGATQGFSVVTYTGNGTNGATIGHGLGVAPNMVIVKSRNKAYEWPVYHSSLTSSQTLFLNATYAAATYTNRFNYAGFSSTVFSAGSTGSGALGEVNELNTTYVAYCFSAVAGYSAFGSYTGNGSTDGPFVYLGFRPRWVMVKRIDAAYDWSMLDSSRDLNNPEQNNLFPNLNIAEQVGVVFDFLSNGFKLRQGAANPNINGATYIYACFAENPFKYSLAR